TTGFLTAAPRGGQGIRLDHRAGGEPPSPGIEPTAVATRHTSGEPRTQPGGNRMTTFRDHLFRQREEAADAVVQARADLRDAFDGNGSLAAAMDQAAHVVPYARWWIELTDAIKYGGVDPMIALTNARTTARQALLQTTPPAPNGSWFAIALN